MKAEVILIFPDGNERLVCTDPPPRIGETVVWCTGGGVYPRYVVRDVLRSLWPPDYGHGGGKYDVILAPLPDADSEPSGPGAAYDPLGAHLMQCRQCISAPCPEAMCAEGRALYDGTNGPTN